MNLREEGCILPHSFRKIQSIMVGKTWRQARKDMVQGQEAGIHTLGAESEQDMGWLQSSLGSLCLLNAHHKFPLLTSSEFRSSRYCYSF